MLLRNKKTGEIVENAYIRESHDFYNKRTIAVFVRDGNRPPERVSIGYETLAELNDEWEDYEEPKELYWVNYDGSISHAEEGTMSFVKQKHLGNYFETKEEAEKAVEKLKAWKRLKDNGLRFVGRSIRDLTITYSFDNYDEADIPQMNKDLDLLFGGEE